MLESAMTKTAAMQLTAAVTAALSKGLEKESEKHKVNVRGTVFAKEETDIKVNLES